MKTCRKCKEEVLDGATKCKHCGTDLRNWFRRHKILTGLLTLFILVVIGSAMGSNDQAQNTSNKASETLINVNKTSQVTAQRINYQVTKSWGALNALDGKVIVVSQTNVNEKDMVALGEQLKSEDDAYAVANILVFDNKDAANLYDKATSLKLSENDPQLAFYESHMVGVYSKNDSTGHHEFVIYLNGISGAITKTIKY